jgi:AcrR family transcriptional regulator
MTEERGFYAQMRDVLRDRLLDAAAELTCAEGWNAVTMGVVAERVGISRQSLYKEIGSKAVLGEAVVTRETDRVLAGVIGQLRAHGSDAVAGIPAAVGYVLAAGADNPLIKAILTGADAGDASLLPLLAARPEPVLARAIAVVGAQARDLYGGLPLAPSTLDRLSEIVVRLTLSHLMQPTGPADEAVAQAHLLVATALRGAAWQDGVSDTP